METQCSCARIVQESVKLTWADVCSKHHFDMFDEESVTKVDKLVSMGWYL